MKAYPEDLRLRVVAAIDGGMPPSEVARVFGVSRTTVARSLHLRQTGAVGPRPRHGPPQIRTTALSAALPARLAEQTDATLEELRAWWQQTSSVRVLLATSSRVISRRLRSLGFTVTITPPEPAARPSSFSEH
jgi:transposase